MMSFNDTPRSYSVKTGSREMRSMTPEEINMFVRQKIERAARNSPNGRMAATPSFAAPSTQSEGLTSPVRSRLNSDDARSEHSHSMTATQKLIGETTTPQQHQTENFPRDPPQVLQSHRSSFDGSGLLNTSSSQVPIQSPIEHRPSPLHRGALSPRSQLFGKFSGSSSVFRENRESKSFSARDPLNGVRQSPSPSEDGLGESNGEHESALSLSSDFQVTLSTGNAKMINRTVNADCTPTLSISIPHRNDEEDETEEASELGVSPRTQSFPISPTSPMSGLETDTSTDVNDRSQKHHRRRSASRRRRRMKKAAKVKASRKRSAANDRGQSSSSVPQHPLVQQSIEEASTGPSPVDIPQKKEEIKRRSQDPESSKEIDNSLNSTHNLQSGDSQMDGEANGTDRKQKMTQAEIDKLIKHSIHRARQARKAAATEQERKEKERAKQEPKSRFDELNGTPREAATRRFSWSSVEEMDDASTVAFDGPNQDHGRPELIKQGSRKNLRVDPTTDQHTLENIGLDSGVGSGIASPKIDAAIPSVDTTVTIPVGIPETEDREPSPTAPEPSLEEAEPTVQRKFTFSDRNTNSPVSKELKVSTGAPSLLDLPSVTSERIYSKDEIRAIVLLSMDKAQKAAREEIKTLLLPPENSRSPMADKIAAKLNAPSQEEVTAIAREAMHRARESAQDEIRTLIRESFRHAEDDTQEHIRQIVRESMQHARASAREEMSDLVRSILRQRTDDATNFDGQSTRNPALIEAEKILTRNLEVDAGQVEPQTHKVSNATGAATALSPTSQDEPSLAENLGLTPSVNNASANSTTGRNLGQNDAPQTYGAEYHPNTHTSPVHNHYIDEENVNANDEPAVIEHPLQETLAQVAEEGMEDATQRREPSPIMDSSSNSASVNGRKIDPVGNATVACTEQHHEHNEHQAPSLEFSEGQVSIVESGDNAFETLPTESLDDQAIGIRQNQEPPTAVDHSAFDEESLQSDHRGQEPASYRDQSKQPHRHEQQSPEESMRQVSRRNRIEGIASPTSPTSPKDKYDPTFTDDTSTVEEGENEIPQFVQEVRKGPRSPRAQYVAGMPSPVSSMTPSEASSSSSFSGEDVRNGSSPQARRRQDRKQHHRQVKEETVVTDEFLELIASKRGTRITAKELGELMNRQEKRQERPQRKVTKHSTPPKRGRRSRSRDRQRSKSRSRRERSVDRQQSSFCINLATFWEDLERFLDDESEEDIAFSFSTRGESATEYDDDGSYTYTEESHLYRRRVPLSFSMIKSSSSSETEEDKRSSGWW